MCIALSAGLAGLFWLELAYAVSSLRGDASPGAGTLLRFGALSGERVLAGDWYRLCTVNVLYASPGHILCNGIALLLAGWELEAAMGRAWCLAALCMGGLCCALLSLVVNPTTLVTVGASGAVTGLLTAGFMASFRLPRGSDARGGAQNRSLQILVPTLLPWLFGGLDETVNYAGHVGGALGGAFVGILLWRVWPSAAARAPRSRIASVLAAALAMLFVAAIG